MSDTEHTRASCLPLLLVAVATGGDAPMTRDAIALRTGFTRVQTANTLGNAVHRGYFQASGQVHEGQQCWVLTEKGRERAADAQRRGVRLPDEAQALSPEVLADRALALVTKAPGGLDTEQLSHKLGASCAEIDAALAPAVAQHRLVTCGLLRGDKALIQYRASAGGTVDDWRAHGSLGFHSGMTAQQVQAEQEARAAQAAELAREVRRSPARKPVPPREPAQPPAQAAQTAPAEVTSEMVAAAHAAPAAPPAPHTSLPNQAEPSCVRLHIDWEDLVPAEPPAANKAPKKAAQQAPDRFMCALYSNGALLIDSNDELVTLPLEHTRRLLHYLEHLGAADLLGAMK